MKNFEDTIMQLCKNPTYRIELLKESLNSYHERDNTTANKLVSDIVKFHNSNIYEAIIITNSTFNLICLVIKYENKYEVVESRSDQFIIGSTYNNDQLKKFTIHNNYHIIDVNCKHTLTILEHCKINSDYLRLYGNAGEWALSLLTYIEELEKHIKHIKHIR